MIRAFGLEIKSLSESGTFSGLASTYGNEDVTQDVFDVGAFTRSIKANPQLPLLREHRDPVGLINLTDSYTGLLAEGKLSLDLQLAKDTYVLMRDRVIKSLSIGFQALEHKFIGDVRHILQARVWEVSLVLFPANPLAQVTAVKSVKSVQFQRDEIQRVARELRDSYRRLAAK